MTRPLAESSGDQSPQANRGRPLDPGQHVIDPKYDELFDISWTPARCVIEDVFGDEQLAVEIVETTLLNIGMSWLYVPRSHHFVTTLAMVFALSHFANAEKTTRWEALGRARRQGRSLSSAYDVSFDTKQWFDRYLAGFSARQRRDFDAAVIPLTRPDIVLLLDENHEQVPRLTARLWRARLPEEET